MSTRAKTTTTTPEKSITRRFPKDDPITSAGAGESILTIEEKMGTVELELNRPLPAVDGGEEIAVLIVEGPGMGATSIYESKVNNPNLTDEQIVERDAKFFGGCCVNIPYTRVKELLGLDSRRLQRLVTNFI